MKASRRRDEISGIPRFLANPQSYPEHPRRVELLQTHASWVAVTRRFVYKVKKPVDFGFLDFSTLEKRRHFCEREVSLNRRLCPDVYLGVIAIRRHGRRLEFDGKGEVAEYAVKMRRLEARYFLRQILKAGRVTKESIGRVVATLKAFYSQPCETPYVAKWGRVSTLKDSTTENFLQTKAFIGKAISRPAWEAIRIFTERFYRQHRALFQARVAEGRIRDCHGDLHLEHIHLAPDRVSIYDCIEFNDRFRLIDVASDLAFLAMDLDFHGRADLSQYLVTGIAKGLRDPGMLRILDFYKCYRAFVSGKVKCFQTTNKGTTGDKNTEIQRLARQYFSLALKYAIGGSEPLVLIVMGQVATGKSSLVRSLADELGWEAFSSDRLRKGLAGVPLDIRGNEGGRRRLYSRAMSNRTYAALSRFAIGRVRQGHSVILDATFSRRSHRDALRAKLQRARIDYCFIETRALKETVRQRLAARGNSTSEVSDARLEDYPTLKLVYEPPDELDLQHRLLIKTGCAPETVLSNALQALAIRRASRSART